MWPGGPSRRGHPGYLVAAPLNMHGRADTLHSYLIRCRFGHRSGPRLPASWVARVQRLLGGRAACYPAGVVSQTLVGSNCPKRRHIHGIVHVAGVIQRLVGLADRVDRRVLHDVLVNSSPHGRCGRGVTFGGGPGDQPGHGWVVVETKVAAIRWVGSRAREQRLEERCRRVSEPIRAPGGQRKVPHAAPGHGGHLNVPGEEIRDRHTQAGDLDSGLGQVGLEGLEHLRRVGQ